MSKTATQALNEAREFSPGIAEWIDAQRERGASDLAIHQALNVMKLARYRSAALSKAEPTP